MAPRTVQEGEAADEACEVLQSVAAHFPLKPAESKFLANCAKKRKEEAEKDRSEKEMLKKLYDRVESGRKRGMLFSYPSVENLEREGEKNVWLSLSRLDRKEKEEEDKKEKIQIDDKVIGTKRRKGWWEPTTFYDYYYNRAKKMFEP